MAKLIFKLNSAPTDEADDIKNLLAENEIDFYETPPGNWGISLHALWLNDEAQADQAKKLIEEYQLKRTERIRLETREKIEKGEIESFLQRLLNRPVQFVMLLVVILFILYLSIMPFVNFGGL